jgi:hypothetical protein
MTQCKKLLSMLLLISVTPTWQLQPHAAEATAHSRCEAAFPVAWRSLRHRRRRTVTYICDRRRSPCGGLGDRMAGIIDVIAYALVTNRTLLIDDSALLTAFAARHNHSGQQENAANDSITRSCRGQLLGCKWLQQDQPETHVAVFGANRCELCKWLRVSHSAWGPRLRQLGFSTANVPLAASCLLHAALSPRAHVLNRVAEWLAGAPPWIGVHARAMQLHAVGERGGHGHSREMVTCAAEAAIAAVGNRSTRTGAVVLGDAPAAAREIENKLRAGGGVFSAVIDSPSMPCHVDGDAKNAAACMLAAATDWLGFAMARVHITASGSGGHMQYRSSGFALYGTVWGLAAHADADADGGGGSPLDLRKAAPRDGLVNGSCSVRAVDLRATDGSWLC